MQLTLEFGGGLELLCESVKIHNVDVVQAGEEKLTMRDLLSWVRTNLIKERPEMFMKGDTVRPGVLVLINDCDWELSGQLDTTLEEKDVKKVRSLVEFMRLGQDGWCWCLDGTFSMNRYKELASTFAARSFQDPEIQLHKTNNEFTLISGTQLCPNSIPHLETSILNEPNKQKWTNDFTREEKMEEGPLQWPALS